MTKNYLNSVRSFNYGLIVLGLILAYGILVQFLKPTQSIFSEILNLVFVIAFITCSIIGVKYSVKGRKEPNSVKKIIGIILNSLILVIVILSLGIFIYDVFQLLNAGTKFK